MPSADRSSQKHNLCAAVTPVEPADLPNLGSPDFVLEILNGKLNLTITHIRTLAERFQVSPAVFV